MKKVVLKVEVQDEKAKQKAMQAVSTISGIASLAMDMKDKKLTVIGDVDPVKIVKKLRKWHTEMLTVGPEKPEEKKKEEPKKEEEKKIEISDLVKAYPAYNPYLTTNYRVMSAEEDPNACVIC